VLKGTLTIRSPSLRGNIMKTGIVSRASSRLGFWFLLLPLLLGLHSPAFAQADFTIYDEALASGWQNWSWATVDTASTTNANTGTVSIAVTAPPYSALYLRSAEAPSTLMAT